MSNKIVIICGPSGTGKTTIAKILLQRNFKLKFSVSATTRNIREGETNAKDYYFLSIEDFDNKIKNNEFVEYQEVYKGIYYGTLKSEMERIWNNNEYPLLDVDVEGAINIQKNIYPQSLTIFIHPLNTDVLKDRLEERGTENAENIAIRLEKAENEMNRAHLCNFIVYNDDIDEAIEETIEIVTEYLES